MVAEAKMVVKHKKKKNVLMAQLTLFEKGYCFSSEVEQLNILILYFLVGKQKKATAHMWIWAHEIGPTASLF